MVSINPVIEDSWKQMLIAEFQSPYFSDLKTFLIEEKKKYGVYPPGPRIFAAFDQTPVAAVKVVILGQDPYHGPGQANGLCFSVADKIPQPPSLKNIFLELAADLGLKPPVSGNLEKWARQGVLLLNATLTVRQHQAASHQGKGWEIFTDAVIRGLNENKTGLIFLLWGNYAIAKQALIDKNRHHILTAAHPSPFSANKGFFGCRHFSKTNALLKKSGQLEIDWRLD